MNKQLDYSGISTKIRAMGSSLLTHQMYEDIAYLPTVLEFVSYLKQNTSYGAYFAAYDEATLHRGQIEQILTLGSYRDFVKIYLFAGQTQRAFLIQYFKIFEINLIKNCMRHINTQSKIASLPAIYDDFFRSHSDLDIPKIYGAFNLDQMLEYLKGTEYYALLAGRTGDAATRTFDYEAALDQYFYESMWKSINRKFSASLASTLKDLYGSTIDLLNILWIYRSRFHYNLPSTDIIKVLIPVNHHINTSSLRDLTEADTAEEFNSICRESYYFRHYKISDVSKLDESYHTIIHDICTKAAKRDPYSIATIYAYLVSKDYERRNLTRMLECIRYCLEPSEIMKYINGGL
jgi:V/A-type H+-transporting ATPase subunit C